MLEVQSVDFLSMFRTMNGRDVVVRLLDPPLREFLDDPQREYAVKLEISVGTMIELPRACLVADQIDKHADFFCFGTNDLTQTVFGFSRDDAEAKFIPVYLHKGILDANPFETIDDAVLEMVSMAVSKGRKSNPAMSYGVCGEHGGDPSSIKRFFKDANVDHVSCSPYRVPIARLSAAHAMLELR